MDKYYEGKVKWFGTNGESYGFLDYEEGQIYVHFKALTDKGQRDPKYKEVRKGDTVRFKKADGHGENAGTQAVEVEIVAYAESEDKDQRF